MLRVSKLRTADEFRDIILKYDPTGAAAEAYRDLAKEVLNGAKAREHA